MNIPKAIALMGVEQVQEYIKLKEEIGKYDDLYVDAKDLYYECYDALKITVSELPKSPQYVASQDMITRGIITKAYEVEQVSKNMQLALCDLLRYKTLITDCKQKIKDKFNV